VLTFTAVGFNDMLSWRNDYLVPPDVSTCNDTGMQKSKWQADFLPDIRFIDCLVRVV